jgi:LuxR family quorum-sensing system transcriptional regulator CciR
VTQIRPKLNAVSFYAELQRQEDVASCAALFKTAIAAYGFDAFACGELDIDNRDLTVFHIIEWPDDWRKFYVDSGMIERDPLIDALRERRAAFTWSELRKDRKLSKAGGKALKLAAQHGWREGLAVPVPRGGARYGLVSLVGHAPLLSANYRDLLSLISECLLARIRALGAPARFPAPPAGLTAREIDAVRLVALGCSDGEIGEALGISRATAHQHVEGGRKRLHAKSRAQMTGRAVALGIVDAP